VTPPSALIADDEPLLRERLRSRLARLWPELKIVGEARHGREAVELFEAHRPQLVFLDVQMPGLSGIDAARKIARRAAIVFVTAHEQYAVQAFEQGAIDYLVKPFDDSRIADTVVRLKERFAQTRGEGPDVDAVLDRLAAVSRLEVTPGAPICSSGMLSTSQCASPPKLLKLRLTARVS